MNKIIEHDGYLALITSREKQILVNKADYERIKRYTWSVDKRGYAVANIQGKKQTMHRMIKQAPPHIGIDHINGNPLDNRTDNLRICNQHENMGNMGKDKSYQNYYSKYKGVTFDKRKGKYMARVTSDYRGIFLGYYDNEIEAAAAYDRGAIKCFGEFARINNV